MEPWENDLPSDKQLENWREANEYTREGEEPDEPDEGMTEQSGYPDLLNESELIEARKLLVRVDVPGVYHRNLYGVASIAFTPDGHIVLKVEDALREDINAILGAVKYHYSGS